MRGRWSDRERATPPGVAGGGGHPWPGAARRLCGRRPAAVRRRVRGAVGWPRGVGAGRVAPSPVGPRRGEDPNAAPGGGVRALPHRGAQGAGGWGPHWTRSAYPNAATPHTPQTTPQLRHPRRTPEVPQTGPPSGHPTHTPRTPQTDTPQQHPKRIPQSSGRPARLGCPCWGVVSDGVGGASGRPRRVVWVGARSAQLVADEHPGQSVRLGWSHGTPGCMSRWGVASACCVRGVMELRA